MRNSIWILAASLVLAATPLTAEAGNYFARVGMKLGHGLSDIAYAPAELLISPVTHAIDFDRHERSSVIGLYPMGVLVGSVKYWVRLGRGATDVITCLFPSERRDYWDWNWSYQGFHKPLSQPVGIEDAH